jgi:hypothetical protein
MPDASFPSLSVTTACQPNGGQVTATLTGGSATAAYECYLYHATYSVLGAADTTGRVFTFSAVPNGQFTLEVSVAGTSAGSPGDGTIVGNQTVRIRCATSTPVCDLRISAVVVTPAATIGGLGSVRLQVETRAATFQAVIVRLSDNQSFPLAPVYQPGPFQLDQVAVGSYRLRLTDANGCTASQEYTLTQPAPVVGCLDASATNYNPLATQADNRLCRYTPRWVGVWSPDGVPVVVRPTAVPAPAYLSAELYAGYPAGHSLAAVRPLRYLATLRATVAPTGLATFDLAPYLRSELGALQDDGSRRLDLNSLSAQTDDLYVGFRLEMAGQGMANGYALNSALGETKLEGLRIGQDPLWPFGVTFPLWPGLSYFTSKLHDDVTGRLGEVQKTPPASASAEGILVAMPCPSHPLAVAWLAPEGGYGYWVFEGRHRYGDEIGEGQAYTEALTNELRYSRRAPSRRTIEASSGVFSDRALVEGLRSLRRAVQAWYRPTGLVGPWVPIVLQAGNFPAYREGRRRYEVTIQFSEGVAQTAQGQ